MCSAPVLFSLVDFLVGVIVQIYLLLICVIHDFMVGVVKSVNIFFLACLILNFFDSVHGDSMRLISYT